MTIYNVRVTFETTMVVIAGDEDEAYAVAVENAKRALDDEGTFPDADVRGEVTSEKHLRDGWDENCVPYGGDGNTRLRDLFPPNAGGNATERSEGRVEHNVGRMTP